MSFKRVFLFLVIVALATSCATAARYTYEEIKGYPTDIQDKIMRGEVSLGMTPQQVRYAWGAPNAIRTLEPLEGKSREEWIYTTLGIYEIGVYKAKRLLFVDGKLMYIAPEPERPKESEKR